MNIAAPYAVSKQDGVIQRRPNADDQYKAKAFIDMFVQRFAKAVAVAVSLVITAVFQDFASPRWLSLFTLLIIALWLVAARYAGRHFREVTETAEAPQV